MKVKLICVDKLKDKYNKIYSYVLVDNNNGVVSFSPYELKTLMKNNIVTVSNLKLTSDNKIISSNIKSIRNTIQKNYVLITRNIIELIDKPKALSFKTVKNIEGIIDKAELLGTYNTTWLREHILLLENSESLIIASDVTIELDGTIENPGGYSGLFSGTSFTSINLNNVNTSNINNMALMFFKCHAERISFGTIDTSNVTNMFCMFYMCRVKELDLRVFDVSKVEDMGGMFHSCSATKINISGWKTPMLKDTSNMFAYCDVTELDFSGFDTSKVTNMSSMFMCCLVDMLDLSSFDTSKVLCMEYMFNNCKSKEINLISFNTNSLESDIYIFYKCKANIKCRDARLLERIAQERKRSNNK